MTILEQIQKPKAFDAFINENMKISTYKVGWDQEMDVEYEPSETFQAATADYAAAMLGTVVGPNSGKPKRDMPSIGEIQGTISRMADEWQMDNVRLRRYMWMEDRFRSKSATMSDESKKEQFAKLVKYLFNPYETASIAPHRRILAQYWEGFSDGQVTLTKTNNSGGVVWSTGLSNGIEKKNLRSTDVVWSDATLETMDVIAVIQYLEDIADAKGKVIVKFRVSKKTASLICRCKQFKELIGLNVGRIKTTQTPGIGLSDINLYLTSLDHAPIEVISDKGILNTGTAISMFKDNRLVAQCADRVAILKATEPLEQIDPVPNKVYSTYKDNLVSQWRNDNGRFIAYEMYAYPVFTGRNDVFILDVSQKDT